MARYGIVKWSPDTPEKRLPAIRDTYLDFELAMQIKHELERSMPHRRFAVHETGQDNDDHPSDSPTQDRR